MAGELSRVRSPAAVQAALDEFARLGRSTFLERYGFGKSRDFLVRNPRTGELCDSKAIVGVAYGHQFPEEGALTPSDFSGGEATVQRRLQSLGFEVVRIGEDWSAEEVEATVAAYFEMLLLEARQTPYRKTEFNLALRAKLRNRSKASVELKHQNISAVLHAMGLPFIPGYKPRGNSQLLLRKSVQQFVLRHTELVKQAVDALEEHKAPGAADIQGGAGRSSSGTDHRRGTCRQHPLAPSSQGRLRGPRRSKPPARPRWRAVGHRLRTPTSYRLQSCRSPGAARLGVGPPRRRRWL